MTNQESTTTVEPVAGITDGLIGSVSALGNPAAAASRIRRRWFWIYPFLIFAAAVEITQIATTPQRMRLTQAILEQRGMTGEQIQTQLALAQKFAPVGLIISPIIILLGFMFAAWLVGALASVAGARGKFSQYLGICSAGAMPAVLQIAIGIFLIRAKPLDEIQTAADLQPPFGLNIFVEHAPKMVLAALAYFSVFELWGIVMTALIFAALYRTSVGKAFFATSPAWIVGLLFALLGSLFT